MAKERAEIADEHKWNVASLYPSLEAWEKGFKALAKEKIQGVRFPEIQKFQGKMGESPDLLAKLLKAAFELERNIVKLYTYAHLRHDEDVVHDVHKNAYDRISLLYYEYDNETSWIQPELLQLDETTFQMYLKAPELKDYQIYLKKVYALKPHTLSSDKEALLALAGKALQTSQKAFSLLNDADLKFPQIETATGEKKDLSYGSYLLYMQSKDRTLRKNAFVELHKQYQQFENTICELINGQVQNHIFIAKARHYPSALHASLTPHQIDVDVYHNLIKTVRENIGNLHRYIKLRKKLLGVDQLHCHDLHVSLLPEFEKKYTFDEAKAAILESVSVMGRNYQATLEKGLGEERWVDLFENKRKRSGAYSSGCYDSIPFILMNFHGTLRDVMTLSHEAGHSMHSYLSNHSQPYQYSHYPIFLAEIASTFHEDLLFRYFVEKASSRQEKCYFLNQKIDDIRATLFRQTQFAEFELKLHVLGEQGIPLTPTTLKEAYRQLNIDYYGPDLTADPEIDVEFLRIPHFYYNFYVYQYATGISAASALVQHVLTEGESARDAYIKFLSSGSSKYPLELLQEAGVDMHSKEPIEKLLHRFNGFVTELEKEMQC
ncbi:MAG: oligoendopeptidase F [Simkania sp.]|nr:oligoendopeptidase F [Simkania sp.]